MSAAVPRILYNNVTHSGVLIPSSEQATLPASNLQDQLPSRVWRSGNGWTVDTCNNKIDFNRGGVKVATVASGTYTSTTDVCAAVVAALEAADATPVWGASYSLVTGLFTISSDLAFSIIGSGGANTANGFLADIGFFVNTGSATSQVGGIASYQSRHYIYVDLAAATDFRTAALIGHNLTTNATVNIQASASTFAGVGLGASPTVSQAMTGTDIRLYYFSATQTYRYLRILFTDNLNTDGYVEAGVWFAGPYLQTAAMSPDVTDSRDGLSNVTFAINGAHYQTIRQSRRNWKVTMRLISTADKTALETFEAAVKIGGDFFYNFDSADTTNIRYVFMPQELSFDHVPTATGSRWTATMELREALG